MPPLYTVAEMARDFGSYPKQIRALIRLAEVPTFRVGTSVVVDQEGRETVRRALDAYRNRPILSEGLSRKPVATG